MNAIRKGLTPGNPAVEDAMAPLAALEILSRLSIEGFSRRLDEFLSMHPEYEPRRARLLWEGKCAAAACAIAGYCHSCGELGNSLDIARCVELALSKAEGSTLRKSRKNMLSSASKSTSEIEDYITVFRYVLIRGQRLAGHGADCIPTPLRSVAYLMVKKAMKGRHPMDEEFGNTVHLLEEVVVPMLISTFEEFSNRSAGENICPPRYGSTL